jgi:hypothetical protein
MSKEEIDYVYPIPEDKYNDVIEHLRYNFFADEPLNKCVGLCETGRGHSELELHSILTLQDNLSVMAVNGNGQVIEYSAIILPFYLFFYTVFLYSFSSFPSFLLYSFPLIRTSRGFSPSSSYITLSKFSSVTLHFYRGISLSFLSLSFPLFLLFKVSFIFLPQNPLVSVSDKTSR